LLGNFPHAVLCFLHAAVFVDHGVAGPLGGVAPADGFAVGGEDCVVEGLEDALHFLAYPIQDVLGLGAATEFDEGFEDGTVEGGVRGDLAFAAFAEEALADDFLDGGAGGVAQVFERAPFGSECLDFVLECEQALGEFDDSSGGFVVAGLHGTGPFAADALLFFGERVAQQAEGGGDVVLVGLRVHARSDKGFAANDPGYIFGFPLGEMADLEVALVHAVVVIEIGQGFHQWPAGDSVAAHGV